MAKRGKLFRLLKKVLAKSLYQEGSVRAIFWGPCRGLRYRIFPEYGLSPLYGGWEPEAQRVMTEHIRPGFIAYDIGANYGIHSLLMAKLVGEHGHVYAFEPVPEILSHLQENVALNRFFNVTCVDLAISDRVGEESFFRGHHGGAGHLATAGSIAGERLMVETLTLDEFVFGRSNRPPGFIKIDVEGAESIVLAGAEGILGKYRPMLLVDLHTPEEDVAVGKILFKFGYEAFRTADGSRVKDLTTGWPCPDGLWGQFIGFPVK